MPPGTNNHHQESGNNHWTAANSAVQRLPRYPMACDDTTPVSLIQCRVPLDLVRDTMVSRGSNIWRTSYYKAVFWTRRWWTQLPKIANVLTHWNPCCHAKGLAQKGMQCCSQTPLSTHSTRIPPFILWLSTSQEWTENTPSSEHCIPLG